jgi:predicted PolB exonuclease-like 3'-5' exonuclease
MMQLEENLVKTWLNKFLKTTSFLKNNYPILFSKCHPNRIATKILFNHCIKTADGLSCCPPKHLSSPDTKAN